ncbi:hypothetical protein RS9916_31962 [Synechococcus sp. RS9916]|nr:hypothetical protein RS9916_31962 [Synechococcus sp. RS9916]
MSNANPISPALSGDLMVSLAALTWINSRRSGGAFRPSWGGGIASGLELPAWMVEDSIKWD